MDDIKLKFLELINKEELIEKIPIVTSPVEYEYNTPDDSLAALDTVQKPPPDNEKNTDVLDNIESDYFIENGFDPSRYELMKLSDSLKLDQIENNLHHLQSQLAVVSKKVLSMILENQPACQQEFEKMQDICKSLKCGLQVCRNARTHLYTAQKLFTTASLGILSNYRRRKVILELLKSLNTIKTLLKTEARWEELLADGDYSNAISVLLEYQQVALSYRHFHCVVVLSNKLQDTLVMAEEQLDVALAKLCYKFDPNVYSKLQAAYSQLGKRRIAMDQFHMHYTSAIHSSAFNVVYRYVRQECNTSNSKKPYAQLCKEVDGNKLIQCLLQLCQSLWAILCSYNSAVHWHNMKQNTQIDSTDIEQSIDEQYIRQKLESGLGKLWHDVQSRVSLLVSSSDVSHSKFDEFLRILAILHRLIQVGEEFCGSDSAELQLSIKGQSSNYFRNYHLSRLGELRLFLENEAWTPCPVKSDFNLLHLQEFRDLRYVVQNASLKKSSKYSDSADRLSCGSSGYFSRYSDSSNTPFDGFSDLDSPLSLEEDILLNEDERSVYVSEDSEDEEFDKKYKENMPSSSRQQNYLQKKTSVLLTNTTLTVLRHCGRYLQMSHLLRSITIDVIVCLRQLFEYYLYAVCNFFSADLPEVASSSVQYSIYKLKSVLNRIEDNFIESKPVEMNDVVPSSGSSKVLAPCISPMVDLTNSEQLYGLIERMVGVESLVLLSEQFNLLRDYLEHLIDETEYKHTLSLFYSQVISVASEVRIPVYECVARKIIDSKNILYLMSKVNWEVKDVMCQHSQYVDVLLRELQIFAMRLENLSGTVTISSHVATYLWQSIAEFLSEIFVEGFSNAKKCSNGGRALMQLDYTQLMLNLEKLSGLKPIPKREFVESYVKAYYLPESTLQNWIVEHTEYSTKQLIALINCACSNNKKTRQRLIGIIEEAADRR